MKRNIDIIGKKKKISGTFKNVTNIIDRNQQDVNYTTKHNHKYVHCVLLDN